MDEQIIPNSPTQTPNPHFTTHPRHWKRLLLLIAGIVILLSLICWYVLGFLMPYPKPVPQKETIKISVFPTPKQNSNLQNQPSNPTADWKTYHNNLYGFSFKYPATWTLSITPLTSDYPNTVEFNLNISPNFKSKNMIEFLDNISFTIADNPQNLSIVQFVQQSAWISGGINLDQNGVKFHPMKVDNFPAESTNHLPSTHGRDVVLVSKGSRIYDIEYEFDKSVNTSLSISKNQFNQVLSTIKFTQ